MFFLDLYNFKIKQKNRKISNLANFSESQESRAVVQPQLINQTFSRFGQSLTTIILFKKRILKTAVMKSFQGCSGNVLKAFLNVP